MTRLVRNQLVALVIIAVVGIVYVGANYVHLDHLLGFGVYHVRVTMPRTGNVTTNAEVTYRGVPVGRVGATDVTDDGVVVRLDLDSGKPKIPDDAKAVVADRSAIGEQFVDLQPGRAGGPYLHDGSVIEGAQLPVKVEDLLASVNGFAASTDLAAVRTTVTELGHAFDGQGDNLRSLLDSLNLLSRSAADNLPQTVQLIHDAQIVLQTQADQSPAIRQFSDGLDQVAAQLRSNDPDIRRLIGTGTDAGNAVGTLLTRSGDPLTTDLTNLRQLLLAVSPEYYALRPLLQMLPMLSWGGSATAPGDNTSHFGLVLETNNPPACTIGYEGTKAILDRMKAQNPDFDDTRDDFPFNTDAKCAVPQGSVTAVRGGERANLADPLVPQPWDDNPKVDPDKLNLAPLASQLAPLLGVTPK